MRKSEFRVFVVEDNDYYNKLLLHTLSLDPEVEAVGFWNGRDFLERLPEKPDMVTLDYSLPDLNGLELLKTIKTHLPECMVVMISEQEEIKVALDLLKTGAYDYLIKSEDIRDKLLNLVRHARKESELHHQVKTLTKEVQKKYDFSTSIIGKSPAIQSVFEMMQKSLMADLTVSITGETGTGKELIAKAIHYNSARKNKPFIAVNIAAIPNELVESELFGHEKGAFTGAAARRKGKFEQANGGTIFLDEISEIDLNVQKKLLRVLQEREVTRIGGEEIIPIECRVITATHRNLMDEVKAGNFREDLYYRLFGLPVVLPPLRERGDDIILLAKYFLDTFTSANSLPAKVLGESSRHRLLSYHWPGNVRELKSVIELAAVISSGDQIEAGDLTFSGSSPEAGMIQVGKTLRQYNRELVEKYMELYDQKTAAVAEALDIGQSTVYRLLKEGADD